MSGRTQTDTVNAKKEHPKLTEHEYRFCPRCGAELVRQFRHGRVRPVCPVCGYIQYLNPAPAVAVVLLQGNDVLLVRRRYSPRKGYWSLPAGFVEWDEDIRTAAVREVKEETNCDVEVGEVLGAFSAFDDPRTHVVLIVFAGRLKAGSLRAGDDATEARFFPLDALPEDMAFAVHRQVLEEVREKRRNVAAEELNQVLCGTDSSRE